jgi:hypothetical protein
MSGSRQQLYLDLEALSEEQIETGLKAGVWGEPARPAVQRYLDLRKLERIEAAAAEQLQAARLAIEAARKATEEARRSNLRASIAIIFAIGAMIAAIAAAVLPFLALRNWTW